MPRKNKTAFLWNRIKYVFRLARAPASTGTYCWEMNSRRNEVKYPRIYAFKAHILFNTHVSGFPWFKWTNQKLACPNNGRLEHKHTHTNTYINIYQDMDAAVAIRYSRPHKCGLFGQYCVYLYHTEVSIDKDALSLQMVRELWKLNCKKQALFDLLWRNGLHLSSFSWFTVVSFIHS